MTYTTPAEVGSAGRGAPEAMLLFSVVMLSVVDDTTTVAAPCCTAAGALTHWTQLMMACVSSG